MHGVIIGSARYPTYGVGECANPAITISRSRRRAATGVELVDAVAASCAVPGVWPPVTIGTSRYMDGGVRTITNVDLARDYRRVLVIAPLVEPDFADQLAELTSRVEVIQPDADSLAAFGTEMLDPAVRTPAALAGRAQGQRAAASVSARWS